MKTCGSQGCNFDCYLDIVERMWCFSQLTSQLKYSYVTHPIDWRGTSQWQHMCHFACYCMHARHFCHALLVCWHCIWDYCPANAGLCYMQALRTSWLLVDNGFQCHLCTHTCMLLTKTAHRYHHLHFIDVSMHAVWLLLFGIWPVQHDDQSIL